MMRARRSSKTAMAAASLWASLCVAALANSVAPLEAQQDILRQPPPQSQTSNQNQDNSLMNIQLPAALASLSPEQLHHLAQLRELQLQQQAAQQQQQQQQMASSTQQPQQQQVQPTSRPAAAQMGAQIPQPSTGGQADAATPVALGTNERHDDGGSGAYNEASELGDAAASSAAAGNNDKAPSQPTFEVNWNKCPQLEPSEAEKAKKTQVITGCLQAAPIPQNLTRENVEAHREQIASCALKAEGWFDDKGDYRYEKAESEIRAKRLDGPIEVQVLKFHVACREEASKKFPRDQQKLIDQVQFYQACMDYYISIVCEIEVSVDQ